MTGWWARRGLRTRITLVVAGVAVLALVVLLRLAAGLLVDAVVAVGDTELRERARTAQPAVVAGIVPPAVRVADVAGTAVDGRAPLPLAVPDVRRLAAGEAVTVPGPGVPQRWVAVPVTLPDGSPRLVLAARDLVGATALVGGVGNWWLPGVALAVGVLSAAAWLATRAALRPVDRLRSAAAVLGPGERLPVGPAGDELAALATEINAVLARRDDAVDRLRRFADDAAHELRSPIAALRAQAEVAVEHPDPSASPAERETWRAVADDARRLSEILADLLALARADGGARARATSVDLADAAGEALARAPSTASAATGEHADVERVVTTVWAPVAVHAAASPVEVGLVLDNLLANARRHARSVVHVSVVPAGRWARLLVDDDGPGIPPEERERVFDRFTRLDGVAGTGSGLGLALVARLVEGRGGRVRAGVSPDGGARLTIRWPAAGP